MKKKKHQAGKPLSLAMKPRRTSLIVVGLMDCPACGQPNVKKLKDSEDEAGFYLEDHGMPNGRGGETQESCPGIEQFGTVYRIGGHLLAVS